MRRAEGETATALAADVFRGRRRPAERAHRAPHRRLHQEPPRRPTSSPTQQRDRGRSSAPGNARRCSPSRTTALLLVRAPRRARRAATRGRASCGARRPGSCPRTTVRTSPTARPRCCRWWRPRPHIDPARAAEPGPDRGARAGASPPYGRPRPRLPGVARRRRHERRHRERGAEDRGRARPRHPSTRPPRVPRRARRRASTSNSTTWSWCAPQVPKAGEVRTYGVVTEAEAVYEGAAFESDTHRDRPSSASCPPRRCGPPRSPSRGSIPRSGSPPTPASPSSARRARSASKALYVDEMGRPLAGRARAVTALPVHVDLDFFDGRKGGHMSISGISGVATKTSFALFFLRMLTAREHAGARRRGRRRPARARVQRQGRGPAVARQAEPRCSTTTRAAGWGALGVEPAPFPSVSVLGAAAAGVRATCWCPTPAAAWRASRCSPGRRASSSTRTCCSSCFTDANDARNQIPFIRERVQAQLQRFAVDVAAGPARSCCAIRCRGRDAAARPVERGRRRARHHGPAVAGRRARGVPRARRRRRTRPALERARPWAAPYRVHAAAARRVDPARSPGARGRVAPHRPARAPASPWWRSSRCTSRRSASWWARS